MSTRTARTGTAGSGRPGRLVGMAAAGLAVVIAAGFVFALNSGNEPTAQPAHPSAERIVWQDRFDFMAEQRVRDLDSQPTLNIEKYRLEKAGVIGANSSPATVNIERHRLEIAGVIGPAASPTLNIEKYKLDVQNAVRSLDIASQRYEEYVKMLTRQAHAEAAKQQAMWDQRFDDLVERFENQLDGGTGLRPLVGRS